MKRLSFTSIRGFAFAVAGLVLSAGTCGPARINSSLVSAENAQPGNSDWQVTNPATALRDEVDGYADKTSYARDETINLYLSSNTLVAADSAYATVTLDFYRLGWYGGTGARLMKHASGVAITKQGYSTSIGIHAVDPTNMIDCSSSTGGNGQTAGALATPTYGPPGPWKVTYSTAVPASWVSGYYVVRITGEVAGAANGKQSMVVFIIRDDQRKSKVLVQAPTNTWQAYNGWGGSSFYTGINGYVSHRVSFNRPYGYGAGGGNLTDATAGTGQLMKQDLRQNNSIYIAQPCGEICNGGVLPWRIGHTYSVGDVVAHGPRQYHATAGGTSRSGNGPTGTTTFDDGSLMWSYDGAIATHYLPNDTQEMNLMHWLEKGDYDVSYTSDTDVHLSPAQYLGHKVVILPGHSEYWSWEMRDNIDAAIGAGVSVADLSGNESYWQVRFEKSWDTAAHASAADSRILTGYKLCATVTSCTGAINSPDPLYGDAGASKVQKQHTTFTWRSSTVNRNEAGTFGLQFINNNFDGDVVITNPAHDAHAHWIYTGVLAGGIESGTATGVSDGTVLPGVLGAEVDSFVPINTTDATVPASSPLKHATAQTQLTYSENANHAGTFFTASSQIYTAASGALVWSTSTYDWSWGLDGFTVDGKASRVSSTVQAITSNFLAHVGAAP